MYGLVWCPCGKGLRVTGRQFCHPLRDHFREAVLICIHPENLTGQVAGKLNNGPADMTGPVNEHITHFITYRQDTGCLRCWCRPVRNKTGHILACGVMQAVTGDLAGQRGLHRFIICLVPFKHHLHMAATTLPQ